MDPDPTLEAIFLKALEKTSPEDRAAYLDQASAGAPRLREQVEKLLSAHAQAGSFLEPVAEHAGETRDFVGASVIGHLGSRIGPYKLLQQIGEGGMGTVFMAEQTEPVRRQVALKIIKPGMDSRQILARFEAERQALAMMDHPNIAKVFEARATASGRPYFVMELVKAIPITKYCNEHHLPLRQRLELFLAVCQAVQHAHQKGIIHRDLKPSNVLVAQYDDQAVPKVIDFGVAKAMSQRLTDRTMFTEFGALVGTLEYMSLEQAKLNALDIDTRSDVYALGVLLYELLTGTTPLARERLKQAALEEVLRLIREEEPPPPSTRLSASGTALPTLSRDRGADLVKLKRMLKGELDWIAMKALEKDRSRRYDSASALARDLDHYLKDEAVEACPPSLTYRLRKTLRRHKRGFAMAGALVFLLVTGIVGSTWQAIRATRAEDRALGAEKQAREEGKRVLEHAEDLQQKGERLGQLHYAWGIKQASDALKEENYHRLAELLEATTPGPGEKDYRGFEWHYLWREAQPRWTNVELPFAWDKKGAITISPNGTRYVTMGIDSEQTIQRTWDGVSGKMLSETKAMHEKHNHNPGIELTSPRYKSPDMRWHAFIDKNKLVLWDAEREREKLAIPVAKGMYIAALDKAWRRVLVAGPVNYAPPQPAALLQVPIDFYEFANTPLQPLRLYLPITEIHTQMWSHNPKFDMVFEIWDLATAERLDRFIKNVGFGSADHQLSDDGHTLLSQFHPMSGLMGQFPPDQPVPDSDKEDPGLPACELVVRNIKDGGRVIFEATVEPTPPPTQWLVFHSSLGSQCRWLAYPSKDGIIVHDLQATPPSKRKHILDFPVWSIHFHPSEDKLLMVGPAAMTLVDLTGQTPRQTLRNIGAPFDSSLSIAFAAADRILFFSRGAVRSWKLNSSDRKRLPGRAWNSPYVPPDPDFPFVFPRVSQDGRRAWIGRELWDLETGHNLGQYKGKSHGQGLHACPDSGRVLVLRASIMPIVDRWKHYDLSFINGSWPDLSPPPLPGPWEGIGGLTLAASLVASVTPPDLLELVDGVTGAVVAQKRLPRQHWPTLLPGGRWLYTVGPDGWTLTDLSGVVSVRRGAFPSSKSGLRSNLPLVVVCPLDRHLVIASTSEPQRKEKSGILVMNLSTGQEKLWIETEEVLIYQVFSPDGGYLYWGGKEHFYVWAVGADSPRKVPLPSRMDAAGQGLFVSAPTGQFSPDGRLLAVWLGRDVRLYEIPSLSLKHILAGPGLLSYSSDGTRVVGIVTTIRRQGTMNDPGERDLTLKAWNLKTSQEILEVPLGPVSPFSTVNILRFDGRRLQILYGTDDGKEVRTIDGSTVTEADLAAARARKLATP